MARSGDIPGVIATVTGHLASIALPEPTELTWNHFWVDTGLSRDELVTMGVTAGTRVIWEATTEIDSGRDGRTLPSFATSTMTSPAGRSPSSQRTATASTIAAIPIFDAVAP